VSWIYSKPRSTGFLVGAFVVLMGLVTLFDIIGWDPNEQSFKMSTWLIPGIYCAIFLLLPAFFSKLNEPESVPERVTSK
jgi:ubiquinol-cytochrome c reductase cytochrome b subunit